MIILRKLKKKKQKQELEIVDTTNNIKYFGILRKLNNKLGLYKCKEDNNGNIRPIQPSRIMNILKSQGKIYLSNDDESLKLKEFLEDKNIKYEPIDLCPLCLIEGKYNILDKNDRYKYYNKYICFQCAFKEVKGEVDLNENFIERLLRRFRDVDKIINILNMKDPLDSPELTRYDILRGSDEDKIKNYKIDELNIPNDLKNIIKERGIEELLPVQTLAIKGGLLKNRDLLITSATSSGKTLIGELAGIKNILEGKGKLLFLVPIVALANQKYLEFKERYEKMGLKVSLRVGMGRLSENRSENINTDINNSDIIVGTYEGIDFLIRAGRLRDIGTVVIDEVHTLNMEERGPRLDGLIGRLRFLKSIGEDIQIIYLSATVGNPEELARNLGSDVIIYNGRPVPLERHIIFSKNEYNKLNLIKDIVKREFNLKSKYGFRGQSLIFTYSRKRAEYISNFLNTKGIKSDYYHGGMEYKRRRKVEDDFLNQKIMCVVTTAALAAGVDFPASTAILESLAMGGDWLTSSEFQQICGRAGRKGMHDRGKVYMLVEIGKKYHAKMERGEDEVAFQLLSSGAEDVIVKYQEKEELEQILANISTIEKYAKNREKISKGIKNTYNTKYLLNKIPLIGSNHSLDYIINKLMEYNMIKNFKNDITITKYGYYTAISFLYPEDAETIRKNLNLPIIDLLSLINPFNGLYVPGNIKNKISKIININIPTNFIDAFEVIKENISKITDKNLRDRILPWIMEFEGMIEEDIIRYFSKYIITQRINKKTPLQISKSIYDNFTLQTYSGDIYTYLENTIKILDAIERIGLIYNKKASKEAENYKKRISNPYKPYKK